MLNDPIIEEVHHFRKQLLAKADGDLRKAIDGAARRQKNGGRTVLAASPRAPQLVPKKAGRTKVPAP